jgi:hypothetical protein
MSYPPSLLAPGGYDVLLNGVVIASLVRDGTKTPTIWTAELLENMHPRRRPGT